MVAEDVRGIKANAHPAGVINGRRQVHTRCMITRNLWNSRPVIEFLEELPIWHRNDDSERSFSILSASSVTTSHTVDASGVLGKPFQSECCVCYSESTESSRVLTLSQSIP